jgi:colicin import membrane protein
LSGFRLEANRLNHGGGEQKKQVGRNHTKAGAETPAEEKAETPPARQTEIEARKVATEAWHRAADEAEKAATEARKAAVEAGIAARAAENAAREARHKAVTEARKGSEKVATEVGKASDGERAAVYCSLHCAACRAAAAAGI